MRNTHVNAVRLLSQHPLWHGVIGYDVRAKAPVYRRMPPAFVGRLGSLPMPITDVGQTAMNVWFSHQTGGTDFSDSKLRRAIDLVARGNEFDPVAEYLSSLVWDGKSRLDDWLTTYLGVASSIFARSVGPKFLIAAVARALRPGCRVDHVLVLEGEQGLGKTTSLQILAGQYHRGDLPPLDSKDVKEALRGAWIIELGELASMNKSEITAAKNFLTLTEDTYRAPYGTRSETHPRRFILAGTTNEREWMQDQTGNRRFWPVLCTSIDANALARDRDQLWAEAFARFNRGEPWYLLDTQEIAAAKLEQEKRREVDPWEERVARFVCSHRDFTVSEVLGDLSVELHRQTVREKRRVSGILRTLGYHQEQVRVGGTRIRVFRRVDDASASVTSSRVSHDGSESQEQAPPGEQGTESSGDTRDAGFDDEDPR